MLFQKHLQVLYLTGGTMTVVTGKYLYGDAGAKQNICIKNVYILYTIFD